MEIHIKFRKLGRQYKRFSVRYAIPLFIATLGWNSFRGHVRNQWYIGNNEGVQLNMEENFFDILPIYGRDYKYGHWRKSLNIF